MRATDRVSTNLRKDMIDLADRLVSRLAELKSVVVAFSGGVDSAVVAKAAWLSLENRCIAVTAVSDSLPAGELDGAARLAQDIGIPHRVVNTREMSQPEYVANRGDRCYWCKQELYKHLLSVQRDVGFEAIVNGANVDDLGDVRPGMTAARESGVISPLIECAINKRAVRALAKYWDLPVWNKPAGPCLSSRIAPGVEVNAERLSMIDRAESLIRSWGFDIVRVRLHADETARIEIPLDRCQAFLRQSLEQDLASQLAELGFRYVTLDLAGFRSGNLNQLVTLKPERSHRDASA